MSVTSAYSPNATATPSCETQAESPPTFPTANSDSDTSQVRSVKKRIAWLLWPINIGALVLAAVLVIEQDGPFRDAATWFFAGLLFAVLKIALKYWIE